MTECIALRNVSSTPPSFYTTELSSVGNTSPSSSFEPMEDVEMKGRDDIEMAAHALLNLLQQCKQKSHPQQPSQSPQSIPSTTTTSSSCSLPSSPSSQRINMRSGPQFILSHFSQLEFFYTPDMDIPVILVHYKSGKYQEHVVKKWEDTIESKEQVSSKQYIVHWKPEWRSMDLNDFQILMDQFRGLRSQKYFNLQQSEKESDMINLLIQWIGYGYALDPLASKHERLTLLLKLQKEIEERLKSIERHFTSSDSRMNE